MLKSLAHALEIHTQALHALRTRARTYEYGNTHVTCFAANETRKMKVH